MRQLPRLARSNLRAGPDDPTLLNIGKAYSGLTDAEMAALTVWFKAHPIKDFGRVRLVEPKIVLEVAFDIVQPSARHKSGYALRFPRIVRICNDKPVEEIEMLEAVRRLAAPKAEGIRVFGFAPVVTHIIPCGRPIASRLRWERRATFLCALLAWRLLFYYLSARQFPLL